MDRQAQDPSSVMKWEETKVGVGQRWASDRWIEVRVMMGRCVEMMTKASEKESARGGGRIGWEE